MMIVMAGHATNLMMMATIATGKDIDDNCDGTTED